MVMTPCASPRVPTDGGPGVVARPGVADGGAGDTANYYDGETGFTFSQYNGRYTTDGRSVTIRIAVPSPATAGSPYDIVVQMGAPNEVGWAGLAWGGKMTGNPLMVAWRNGNSAIVSSRQAR